MKMPEDDDAAQEEGESETLEARSNPHPHCCIDARQRQTNAAIIMEWSVLDMHESRDPNWSPFFPEPLH